MNKRSRIIASLALAVVIMSSSCTESKTSTEEKQEISSMDSTKKVINENIDKLEDQTKKVEESLEKLDKEFEEKK